MRGEVEVPPHLYFYRDTISRKDANQDQRALPIHKANYPPVNANSVPRGFRTRNIIFIIIIITLILIVIIIVTVITLALVALNGGFTVYWTYNIMLL